MEPSISDKEVSLIKGMLRMGFKPALVQAYFTRPDRLVNPARIQEIKNNSSARIIKIVAATDEEVGNFLDEYERANPSEDGYAPPQQLPEVTQFSFNQDGKLTIVSTEADLQFGAPEITELYTELRIKAFDLSTYGHNSLGAIHTDISRFLEALPEDPLSASVISVFMRGSSLKSKLLAYKAQRENPDRYPVVDIDAAVAPLLGDLVDAFSLLVNLTPAMAVLESKATTQEQYLSQGEALEAIKPAVDEVELIADAQAVEVLDEQVVAGIKAPEDQPGRAQRSVAFSSVRNFAISIFTPVYHAARYVLGDAKLPSILKSLRNGAAYSAGERLYPYLHDRLPVLVEYIGKNAESLITYAEKIVTNPQLHEFIRSMIEVIRGML